MGIARSGEPYDMRDRISRSTKVNEIMIATNRESARPQLNSPCPLSRLGWRWTQVDKCIPVRRAPSNGRSRCCDSIHAIGFAPTAQANKYRTCHVVLTFVDVTAALPDLAHCPHSLRASPSWFLFVISTNGDAGNADHRWPLAPRKRM